MSRTNHTFINASLYADKFLYDNTLQFLSRKFITLRVLFAKQALGGLAERPAQNGGTPDPSPALGILGAHEMTSTTPPTFDLAGTRQLHALL